MKSGGTIGTASKLRSVAPGPFRGALVTTRSSTDAGTLHFSAEGATSVHGTQGRELDTRAKFGVVEVGKLERGGACDLRCGVLGT